MSDPGADATRARLDDALSVAPRTPARLGQAEVHVGIASWTDRTMTAAGVFYPPDAKSAEARLRYVAQCFPLVEVDSSYYAIPSSSVAEAWVERTPDDFTFNVKAYALMTGHATEVDRLPSTLRTALPAELRTATRVRASQLPGELRDESWRLFRDAIDPLVQSGKLGAVLLQYAPWVVPAADTPAMLQHARAMLPGCRLAVELRSARWAPRRILERTWAVLRDLDITYVAVDEPQGFASSMPPEYAVTTPALAMVRLHGRRTETWEKRGIQAVEKYRYLYEREELEPWVAAVLAMAERAERIHVVFNNCYANYGATNAAELRIMLDEAVAP